MTEFLLIIALMVNVLFLGVVAGWMNKIHTQIDCIHEAETRAYAKGTADCMKMLDILRNREKKNGQM